VDAPKNHAIQLQTVRVMETTLIVYQSDKALASNQEANFKFQVSVNQFDADKRTIVVRIRGEVGSEKTAQEAIPESPFYIRVALAGKFSVDIDNFPVNEVENWGKMNAPIILYPFLREHIYGLASRAGIKEVIIPMLTLPMYKIVASEVPKA